MSLKGVRLICSLGAFGCDYLKGTSTLIEYSKDVKVVAIGISKYHSRQLNIVRAVNTIVLYQRKNELRR